MKIRIHYFKASPLHRIGNFIGGIANTIDGAITVISFGFLTSNIALNWAMFRIMTVFYDSPKPRS